MLEYPHKLEALFVLYTVKVACHKAFGFYILGLLYGIAAAPWHVAFSERKTKFTIFTLLDISVPVCQCAWIVGIIGLIVSDTACVSYWFVLPIVLTLSLGYIFLGVIWWNNLYIEAMCCGRCNFESWCEERNAALSTGSSV